MRLALAGLALIIAAAMLYLSVTVHGPVAAGARGALLLAASALGLGALLMRSRPAMAGIVLLFAALLTAGVVGPGQRYLAVYAAVMMALAVITIATALGPPSRPPQRRSRWIQGGRTTKDRHGRRGPNHPRVRCGRRRDR